MKRRRRRLPSEARRSLRRGQALAEQAQYEAAVAEIAPFVVRSDELLSSAPDLLLRLRFSSLEWKWLEALDDKTTDWTKYLGEAEALVDLFEQVNPPRCHPLTVSYRKLVAAVFIYSKEWSRAEQFYNELWADRDEIADKDPFLWEQVEYAISFLRERRDKEANDAERPSDGVTVVNGRAPEWREQLRDAVVDSGAEFVTSDAAIELLSNLCCRDEAWASWLAAFAAEGRRLQPSALRELMLGEEVSEDAVSAAIAEAAANSRELIKWLEDHPSPDEEFTQAMMSYQALAAKISAFNLKDDEEGDEQEGRELIRATAQAGRRLYDRARQLSEDPS